MFDNQLKLKKKGNTVYGQVLLSGFGKNVLVTAHEKIGADGIDAAINNVVDQIATASEFFPLRNIIGDASFSKAIRLYATIKKGNPAQQTKAKQEIMLICKNSREHSDPTAQDIDYAMSRLYRAEQDNKINISGDFMIDAFGISPANLRDNLNRLAEKNPLIKQAQILFGMLRSRNTQEIQKAIAIIKRLYQQMNEPTVSGLAPTYNRAILIGLAQYMKAHNLSNFKKKYLGDDNVTVGINFSTLLGKAKPAPKKAPPKPPSRPASKPAPKPVPKALPPKALPPKALPPKALPPKALPPKSISVPVKTSSSSFQKTSPTINQKMSNAQVITNAAKAGSPAAITAIKTVQAQAKTGSPVAKQNLAILQTAAAQTAAQTAAQNVAQTTAQAAQASPGASYGPQQGEWGGFTNEDLDRADENHPDFEDEGLTETADDLDERVDGFSFKKLAKKVGKVALQSAVITTLGPAAIPILASKKGRKALGLTKAAKKGDPRAKAAIQAMQVQAATGDPVAKDNLQIMATAAKADNLLPKNVSEQMVQDTGDDYEEPEEDSGDEGDEEVNGFSFSKLIKNVAPLAMEAAKMYPPAAGVIAAAQKYAPANVQKAMGLMKSAKEMDPNAVDKVKAIKSLAAAGVPSAIEAQEAMRIAQNLQNLSELQAASELNPGANRVPPPSTMFSSTSRTSGQKPIDVRIVEWAK